MVLVNFFEGQSQMSKVNLIEMDGACTEWRF